ncbi:MAG: Fe-S protein assembly chaperone HscA [Proteobacteria bacterium]|nr:Fe-S protein assembly chaperone HscA [Pseudomonadota bacterium]
MLLDIYEPGQTPLPHQNTVAVGIDLGTTNSLVAIADHGKPQTLRDEHERALLPSVVAYGKDGKITVGQEAKNLLMEKDVFVISSIKRLMGKGYADVKDIAGELPFTLDESKKDGVVYVKTGAKSLSAIQISAEILRALKARAERALGHPVHQSVITVPAYFDDAARAATKDAARLAGLEVLRLISEPTAAALAYGLDKGAEGIYAVYDLGGGTFDISILKMEKGIFQVLATGGDTSLGGDDFDRKLAAYFISKHENNPTVKERAEILAIARDVKQRLTDVDHTEVHITITGATETIKITRAQFDTLIAEEVTQTIDISKSVFEDAQLAFADIKGVVMVGGSTRVPCVRSAVKACFGDKLLTDVDPERVVALGAALQAEALTRGSDTLLLDVTPLSLGLETYGGLVEKVIPRNTPIPVSRAQEFTTYKDGQGGMKIHVLQGEREMVTQCRSLAQFDLKGIPAMKAGLPRIRVTFTLDADGILTVTARETTTDTEQHIEVQPSYGLNDDEIEKMLRESMEHAREDITLRLLTEAKVEAEVAIRAMEEAIREDGDLLEGKERKNLEDLIAQGKAAMQGKDRDAIDGVIQALDHSASDFINRRVNRSIARALSGKSVEAAEKELNHTSGSKDA